MKRLEDVETRGRFTCDVDYGVCKVAKNIKKHCSSPSNMDAKMDPCDGHRG